MAIVRWEPVRELTSLQNEVNRIFNAFFDTALGDGAAGDGMRRWIPAMDLVETDDRFVLRADLPGVPEEDVRVELDDRVLTISGERKAALERDHDGYRHIERAHGAFSRSLTLPEGVDPDGITARFEHGVLEVTVPKPEARKPRRIAISGGAALEGRETARA